MKNEMTELEKLRAAEARLESEIAKVEPKQTTRLTLMLSDCKKMIGELTLVKMHKV